MALPETVYCNLALVHSAQRKGAAARKAAVPGETHAEKRLKSKVDQCNRVLDALDALNQHLAIEIRDCQRRRSEIAARIERIEDTALASMAAAGFDRLTGNRTSLEVRLAPASLEIMDETRVPGEYLREPKTPPPAPDKIAIKQALAAREDVHPADWGCRLQSKVLLIRK